MSLCRAAPTRPPCIKVSRHATPVPLSTHASVETHKHSANRSHFSSAVREPSNQADIPPSLQRPRCVNSAPATLRSPSSSRPPGGFQDRVQEPSPPKNKKATPQRWMSASNEPPCEGCRRAASGPGYDPTRRPRLSPAASAGAPAGWLSLPPGLLRRLIRLLQAAPSPPDDSAVRRRTKKIKNIWLNTLRVIRASVCGRECVRAAEGYWAEGDAAEAAACCLRISVCRWRW